MTPAKKSEPAVAAQPVRRRAASTAKALAAPPAVKAKAIKAGDVRKRATGSARRAATPVLKMATASAETTVKRAVATTDYPRRA